MYSAQLRPFFFLFIYLFGGSIKQTVRRIRIHLLVVLQPGENNGLNWDYNYKKTPEAVEKVLPSNSTKTLKLHSSG